MEIVIRPASENDLDAMYLISSSTHLSDTYMEIIPVDHQIEFLRRYKPSAKSKHEFKNVILKRIAHPDWYMYVACIDEYVAGYTLAKVTKTSLELRGLFMRPEYQSKGIGSRLFEASLHVVNDGRPIYLKVLKGNTGARRLYERFGFKVLDTPKAMFYGAELLVMSNARH